MDEAQTAKGVILINEPLLYDFNCFAAFLANEADIVALFCCVPYLPASGLCERMFLFNRPKVY